MFPGNRMFNSVGVFRTLRNLSRSPLYDIQSKVTPVLGNYGNYSLPFTFKKYPTPKTVINTRKPNYATVFDVSHMVYATIPNQSEFKLSDVNNPYFKQLERLFPVNMNQLKTNLSKLSVSLNEKGEVRDDFIISNIEDRYIRFIFNSGSETNFIKLFRNYSNLPILFHPKIMLAIQGPGSQNVVEELFYQDLSDLYFMENKTLSPEIEISRCGYTGEDGFEIYLDGSKGKKIYQKLIELSHHNEYIQLGGLLERDILRLEAGLCLSGKEFNWCKPIHFNNLDLDFIIGKRRRYDLNFMGGISLLDKKQYRRVGFSAIRPLRQVSIYSDEEKVGYITSSSKSDNLNKFIGMGYVSDILKDTDSLYCIINNNKIKLNLENLPFIKPKYYRRS